MDDRDLRVSDAEREHVGQLLQRAVGQGMLSLGEFTERMDTVLAAKTRGELNVVLVDLPGIRIDGRDVGNPPAQVADPVTPVHAEAAGDIRCTMSSVTRSGEWSVPSRLRVTTRMASVTLDFTSAVLSGEHVLIEVDDYCSSLTLVVAEGASVNTDDVAVVGGSISNKVRSNPPARVDGARPSGPSSLQVTVRGRIRLGSVTAKHPFGTTIKRMFG